MPGAAFCTKCGTPVPAAPAGGVCCPTCGAMMPEGRAFCTKCGAASVGVPGLIVEYAFHTVAAVRQAAMQGDLAHRWAEADAAGLAEGWGFQNLGAS